MPFHFQYPKQCGYYRFEKEYFQKLKDIGVIVVWPSNWAEQLDEGEEVDSGDCQNVDKQKSKALEEKMDNVIRKMNLFFWTVLCVLVGCLVMYAVMK